ncbi:MAG: hypothetical protein PHI85_08585 [Victivallaceae bacterium]|nr:hypothetical protein [Victivallaceae bacterium]
MNGGGRDDDMMMNDSRQTAIWIALIGMFLPFAANFIGGDVNGFSSEQYWFGGRGNPAVRWDGVFFIAVFNLFAVGAALGSWLLLCRIHRVLRMVPTAVGYGFLAVAHFNLDLSSDAQAGIVLVAAPFFAAVVTAVTTVLVLFGRFLRYQCRRASGRSFISDSIQRQLVEMGWLPLILACFCFLLGGVLTSLCVLLCVWQLRGRSLKFRMVPPVAGIAGGLAAAASNSVAAIMLLPCLAAVAGYAAVLVYDKYHGGRRR